ncbi:MAG: IS3 family transposase [Kofleriaceae bacterium]|nr:IS3 family transposase [Kofleriaceae bacterium]
MKFAYVAAEKARGEFKVSELCRALRVSPSGFYAWCKREPSEHAKKDVELRVLIRASFDKSRRNYGSPRILRDLVEDDGQKVGRNRVIRIMQEEGLKARVRNGSSARRTATTTSRSRRMCSTASFKRRRRTSAGSVTRPRCGR